MTDHNMFNGLPPPPDGFVYEFKDINKQYDLTNHARNGWRFVPPSRHPEFPSDDHGRISDGFVALMERPTELQDDAKLYELYLASERLFRKLRYQGKDEYLSDVSRIKEKINQLSGTMLDRGWGDPEISEIGYLLFLVTWINYKNNRISVRVRGNRYDDGLELEIDFTVDWISGSSAGSFDPGRSIKNLTDMLAKFGWVLEKGKDI